MIPYRRIVADTYTGFDFQLAVTWTLNGNHDYETAKRLINRHLMLLDKSIYGMTLNEHFNGLHRIVFAERADARSKKKKQAIIKDSKSRNMSNHIEKQIGNEKAFWHFHGFVSVPKDQPDWTPRRLSRRIQRHWMNLDDPARKGRQVSGTCHIWEPETEDEHATWMNYITKPLFGDQNTEFTGIHYRQDMWQVDCSNLGVSKASLALENIRKALDQKLLRNLLAS